MADMDITLHHLGTWWDILDETKRTKRFDEHTLNEVEKFLNNPYDWSAANGGISERVLIVMICYAQQISATI